MTKHEGFTPGPWTIEKHPDAIDVVAVGNLLDVIVARTWREDNAALIADAPALLAERDMLRALLVKVAGASHIPGAPLSLLEMYHPAYLCEAPTVCGTCTVRSEIYAALASKG